MITKLEIKNRYNFVELSRLDSRDWFLLGGKTYIKSAQDVPNGEVGCFNVEKAKIEPFTKSCMVIPLKSVKITTGVDVLND